MSVDPGQSFGVVGPGANARVSLLITLASRGVIVSLKILSAVLLARTLGKEGLGLFALLQAVPGVLALLTTLGVPGAAPYLINNRRFEPQAVLSNALLGASAAGLLSALVWLGASGALGAYILKGLSLPWLCLAALLAPLQIVSMVMVFFFRGIQHFGYANVLRILPEAGTIASLMGLLALGRLTTATLVLCLILAYALGVSAGLFRAIRLGFRPLPRMQRQLLAESVSFGLREQATTAIQFFNFRLDHMILAVITTPATVGIYAVATKASELFRIIPGAVNFVLAPRIARQTPVVAERTVRRLLAPVFLGNLAVMIVAFGLGPLIIPLLFDEWSTEAVLPFHILLTGMVAVGANGIFSAFNHGQGRPQQTTYSVAVSLALTIVLDLLLIPSWGILGAAVASSCAYAAGALALALFYLREGATRKCGAEKTPVARSLRGSKED